MKEEKNETDHKDTESLTSETVKEYGRVGKEILDLINKQEKFEEER